MDGSGTQSSSGFTFGSSSLNPPHTDPKLKTQEISEANKPPANRSDNSSLIEPGPIADFLILRKKRKLEVDIPPRFSSQHVSGRRPAKRQSQCSLLRIATQFSRNHLMNKQAVPPHPQFRIQTRQSQFHRPIQPRR